MSASAVQREGNKKTDAVPPDELFRGARVFFSGFSPATPGFSNYREPRAVQHGFHPLHSSEYSCRSEPIPF